MPTHRQKVAFQKTIENHGNVSKAMKEAGYSKSHAHNPQSLTNSKGFKTKGIEEKQIDKEKIKTITAAQDDAEEKIKIKLSRLLDLRL